MGGDVRAAGTGYLQIRGGELVGEIVALESSTITIVGGQFNLLLGELTELSGTLTGLLADGTPLNTNFSRASTATITLVVLAAGAGSRYGGLKQLEPVGSGAATLIDYMAFDAVRAGFERIALVIRPETEDAFRAHFESRLQPHLDVAFCFLRPATSPNDARTASRRR